RLRQPRPEITRARNRCNIPAPTHEQQRPSPASEGRPYLDDLHTPINAAVSQPLDPDSATSGSERVHGQSNLWLRSVMVGASSAGVPRWAGETGRASWGSLVVPSSNVRLTVRRPPCPSPGTRTATVITSLPTSTAAHRSYSTCMPASCPKGDTCAHAARGVPQ